MIRFSWTHKDLNSLSSELKEKGHEITFVSGRKAKPEHLYIDTNTLEANFYPYKGELFIHREKLNANDETLVKFYRKEYRFPISRTDLYYATVFVTATALYFLRPF